jgi:hypothetical protein
MTKYIRIENADTSSYKIKVTTQQKRYDFELEKLTDEWVDTKVDILSNPTQMLNPYLTSTQRFIIEEITE